MAKRIEPHTPKWVEPIIEYQRLADRYQTVEERAENERKKSNASKRPERRFIALRKLVSTLKKNHSFSRLDYPSAESEIRRLGVEKIQNDLADLLTGLELTPAAATQIVQRVLEHSSLFQLIPTTATAQLDHLLYVNLSPGLKVLSLMVTGITIPLIDLSCLALVERCQKGRLMASHNNLLLTVSHKETPSNKIKLQESFEISLSIATGVIEIDDSSRRAFVFQRGDTSFALYADKQINIEI
ncbi:hypothetical protein HTZ97_16125 [Desulfuromonas acetoxidans]|uniref:Uncharacterized protein n=1 Tax=Desulfuromonas acetoxidans (strain DSM 684 / 11070) TaxID=281689 RepID=Q1K0B8_DESA6|nr:hypothetical protein [Desulfuromonas acetoxidans]EAT16023.1 hypothetical protein Dace_2323 [Desulfuromonas acetoxidans DSM 684]MBF0646801.1 hypothetical protein [Desulfuromonas acetoxidans]NVD24622.1 hypothetical protein [Desulfuromonas acetoxidans]NVE17985.1 hypothetical protein [Desulfuromonas acetoxidans]